MLIRSFVLCAALLTPCLWGAVNPELLTGQWTARWIHVPDTSLRDYGVYHFRRTFELAGRPERFVVHVSGDQRYQLFVNGRRVSWGPARGDLLHWRFETVDLAPYLQEGRNVLASVVWNFAEDAPMAQLSFHSGFLLQGDTAVERVVDTGRQWKAWANPAYAPLRFPRPRRQYYVSGSGEDVDGARYPWGWEHLAFDDASWPAAAVDHFAAPRGASDAHSRWMLVPRPIPPMEESPVRFAAVREAEGGTPPAGFPAQAAPWSIPAHTRVRLLLDHGTLTTAFPELVVSGGRGASVEFEYTEALYLPGSSEKGHRDEVAGKEMQGNLDRFHLDGGRGRTYRPLFWRSYRYVQVTVQTAEEPLVLEDLRAVFTAYPFERRAEFAGAGEEVRTILDVGWRSARLCAHETYMDTPYWEQLQYVGDTRIQALVSYHESGDARLARDALRQIDATRTADGLTFSRAPSDLAQYIPPFSLWWIGMLHDYWYYQDDPELVRELLPGVRAVLSWFASHQKENGSLGPLPWWNYVDWVPGWDSGVPPSTPEGSSAALDLQLLLALEWAVELEEQLGLPALAEHYRAEAGKLRATVRALYWDESRHLFSDTSEQRHWSQHSNALALLAGVVTGAPAARVAEQLERDPGLTRASIYFRHYVDFALRESGRGGSYLQRLDPWRKMLAEGLTTWAETDRATTRSDCHAWGASPNIEVFRTVLGIEPAAPGFRRVSLRPQLGALPSARGVMPHPRGEIRVDFTQRDGRLRGRVTLPAEVDGELRWGDQVVALQPGENDVEILD